MDAWNRVEAAIEKAKTDIAELNRRMQRFDARMEGMQGHVDNLYGHVESLYTISGRMQAEMVAFREETHGARQATSELSQQMVQTSTSVLAAFESLAGVSTLLTSVLEQMGILSTRVEALEKKQDAA